MEDVFMRKTYAYNSVVIGILLGMLVYASTSNVVLAILTCLGVSIVGFVIIRVIENAIDKGIDKAGDAISNAVKKHKENKDNNI